MDKLILIDGNSLINRAFYGLPTMNARDGTPSNAIYGFVSMMIKLIEQYQPKYMVVAFDMPGPNFRHSQFADYKGTRKAMPDDLKVQLPLLKDLLTMMEICIVQQSGVEADDLLGSLSKIIRGVESYIVTSDRDCLQLIDENTTVLLTKKGITDIKTMDSIALMEEWGLTPSQIIDYKALCGDASDNIPGVAGIGDKSALNLLQKYGTLDGVYKNLDSIVGKQQSKLTIGRDSAYMSYKLATIVTDIEIDFELDKALIKFPFSDSIKSEFAKLSFNSFLKRTNLFENTVQDIVVSNSVEDSISKLPCKIVTLESLIQLDDIWKLQYSYVYLHIESNNIQFCLRDSLEQEISIQYTIDVNLLNNDFSLLKCLYNSNCNVVVYDAKLFMHKLGDNTSCKFFDIRLMQYLIDINYSSDTVLDWIKYYDISLNEIAFGIYCIWDKLDNQLNKLGLKELYYDIELPLVRVLYLMEKRGFAIDISTLRKLQNQYTCQLQDLATQIKVLAGKEFNVQSPKQLAQVLFEDMKLEYPYKKPKSLSTSADILRDVQDDTGIISLVLKYRELAKLNSTYVDGLLKAAGFDRDDMLSNNDTISIVRTDFRQMSVATGRLSSNEPNLQNIPVRTQEGRNLRRAFVARQGYSLLFADYNQIELRLLAHLSGDKIMCDAYLNSVDIHTTTASVVFGVELQQVTSEMRRAAKAVNFGIVYGISDFGLASDLKISVSKAKEYINTYFEKYSTVKLYLDECVKYATQHGYIKSMLGRIRYIPELKSSKNIIRQHGQRIAMNMPMQGSASDIIKLAMLKVHSAIRDYDAHLIHQIHDELIVECRDDQTNQVAEILKQNMNSAIELSIPLEVGTKIKKVWE